MSPAVNTYRLFRYEGFPGGLNRHSDPAKLVQGELAEATNVRLGLRGEVELRTGYTRYDVAGLVASTSKLFPWRAPDGTDHMLLADSSTDIWHSPFSTTFTDSTYQGGAVSGWQENGITFAGAEGKAYVTSKTFFGDPANFDGTSWTTVAGFPKAKNLVYRHGRMFATNTLTRPSGIHFSNLLDVETWTASDYLELDPDDGFEINNAIQFGDDLLMFKDHSIWKLSGRSPSTYAVYQIDSLRGTVAWRGVCQMRGKIFFVDRDTGIWSFDGANLEKVSEAINDYLLENQDYDLAHRAAAYSIEGRVYFSIPWTGATWKMFVYFEDTGGWTEYDGGFNDSVYYLGERYHGLPTATGLYTADSTSKLHPPSGTDIEATFRTGWVRIGTAGFKARVRRIEAIVDALDAQTVTVNMYRDYDPTTVYKTQTFTGGPAHAGSATDQRIIALDGWGNRVQAVQFEFVTSDPPFVLSDMTVFYTGGIDVRGDR